MENRSRKDPLRVYCRNCGAPAGFDILHQTYRCPYCGELTGIQEARENVAEWRTLQKENTRKQEYSLQLYSCPACGTQVSFPEGDASAVCDFCGSALVRNEFSDEAEMPEMIIPFFITPEEARQRMLDWGHAHENTPEGRSVVSSMDKFRGYYLPYQIVRGPVSAEVSRDGNRRNYHCGGYLEGTAVNTSAQLDNLVLNGIEPFDWSAAQPFEYGYIAGQNVKFSDMSDADTNDRIMEECAEDFLPEVERVMQTSGVDLKMETGEISAIPVLLPVYFIRSGKLTAVMNGQTGRIAVSHRREKTSSPWMIEPLVYTVLATAASAFFTGFDPSAIFVSALMFACLFFAIMGEGKRSLIRRITMRTESAKAGREDGVLKIEEGKDILKNPYDNRPVFYEENDSGENVPVKIRFFSFTRIVKIAVNAAVLVYLPLIVAALVHLVDISDTERDFAEGFHPVYGAAWYVFAGLLAVIYFAKGVRGDVYDHPILYEIRPDGKKKLMGRRASRKVGVLSMFGIGERRPDGKKLTIVRFFTGLGGIGIFAGICVAVLFAGSIAGILS
ncbi:MAG: hypothetical protein ACI4LA_02500 [Emergencia sp.]